MKSLRSPLISLLFVLAYCILASGCSEPDYTLMDGNSGNFTDHRGRWMIINYWATWCKPCIREIPELNAFAASQQHKVVLFGVDYDNNQGEKLQQSSESLNILFPILTADPARRLGYARPSVLPTTLIFDPEGALHRTLIGPQTADSLLQSIATTAAGDKSI